TLGRVPGGAFRPWLLAIVRNTAMTSLKRNRSSKLVLVPDFETEQPEADATVAQTPTPEGSLLQRDMADPLHRAVAALPGDFRAVIVLREVQDLSYKEIAAVIDAPIGTVMSRL